MKQLWFSPLAPALLFLAGAIALLASRRLAGRGSRTAGTLAFSLSLTAAGGVFILLASRVAYRLTSSFTDPPLVLAPWGTGEGLTIRLDGVSIAFLFVPVLLLVASVWARQITACGIMLALAGSAAAVFVAANASASATPCSCSTWLEWCTGCKPGSPPWRWPACCWQLSPRRR
ncbi:MAG: hypothetical protein ACE5G8_06925 [Anaerolineae bacterium]